MLDASQLALIGLFSVILIANSQLAFGERYLDYEKTLDIDKEALETVFVDPKILPKIFPDFVKAVESNTNDDNMIAKIELNLNGFSFYPKVQYSKPSDGTHIIQVISGDLSGTKINTSLEKTWSFDGRPDEGTIVNMQLDLHQSGLLSVLGVIPDNAVLYSVDRFLVDTANYVNSDNQSDSGVQNQNEIDKEESLKVKKVYRKR
jgi:hypothetical protein